MSDSDAAAPAIQLGPAVGTWAIAWVLGMVVLAPAALLAFGADFDDLSIGMLAVAATIGWAVFAGGLSLASRRYGTADPVADYAARFAPVDLVGVPLGVATQLLAVPLVYVPLQAWFPDAFSDERLEERAQDLVDRAGGATLVLLVVVVAVGAPLVEELVYRGLLQRSLSARLGPIAGLVVASAWFAVVHPSPVEYPGLFVAGLAFGAGVVVTGRIGIAIVTHAAFNVTGLALALAS